MRRFVSAPRKISSAIRLAPVPMLASRTPTGSFPIDVRLDSLDGLYSALDPSPFRQRDLDPRAVEHIVQWASDAPPKAPLELRISVPAHADPDATEAGVRRICASLGLVEFLEALPEGLSTELSDQIVYQLPNGVRRLLALAQALIKDTPILLIDDISQGLAPDQFQAVLEALPSMRRCAFSGQDRSVILATDNRLLLEKADRLCILDKGVTSFQGTADELRERMQQKPA